MDRSELDRLSRLATEIRLKILCSIHAAGSGHAGPSLSMVEILTLLYFRVMRHDRLDASCGDRLILSKGHGAPGLYATLAQLGMIPPEELATLRALGSRLQGHPHAKLLPAIDFSTGSLGQGLSVALGLALGFRFAHRSNRVFCVLGDGELQEGQNWEAAMAASAYRVSNLIAVIDCNHFQSDGPTESVLPLGSIAEKWMSFGWAVHCVDGHSFEALDCAFARIFAGDGRPGIVIADTIKGKGVSFMEGVTEWHHHPISNDQLRRAVDELDHK